MQRRQFIRIAGYGAAAGCMAYSIPSGLAPYRKNDLSYHAIRDIRFSTLKLRYPRSVGKNARLDRHGEGVTSGIHVLYTDQGASGWGLNRGSEESTRTLFNLIRGKKVSELIDPTAGVLEPNFEAFDFSLFDLAGKILRKPVYRLLGAKKPILAPCYSGMLYFDDLDPADNPPGPSKIIDECRFDYQYGYRQFKLKIGRGFKWMDKEAGLKRDIEVTRLVAREFPGCDILVDGNNGFTLDEFLKYMEGISDIKLFWIEEPFHETVDDYASLNSWLKVHNHETLLTDGEANPDENVLNILSSQKIIRVLNQDISGMGFTRWIKKMGIISRTGIMASPHAWGSAIKTNYSAHLAGAFGSVPSIEGVTCLSDDVDLSAYSLEKGKLIPSSGDGFGMSLLKKI